MPANLRQKLFVEEQEELHWPNSVVPYMFSRKHSSRDINAIRRAMKEIERNSCFRFVGRHAGQRDYIYFDPGNGCFSSVGRVGGRQQLSLSSECITSYVIVHELLHALGAYHEHQRPDRNQYVTIDYRNIETGWEWVYAIESHHLDSNKYPYDVNSIMNYYSNAFGKPDSRGYPRTTGQPAPLNSRMSQEDIKKLNLLGKC
ncbi:Metalloendopeptidase [Aphelenchoides bicaudatus]|nr:Metalloendopeptidase [Aphelenchoides bicaudatus]